MRKSMIFGIAFGLALLTGSAFAQLAEKKVITLAAAHKIMAAAEAESERNHWAAPSSPWSQDLEDAINSGRIAATTARGFVEMQGALPIIVDDEVIGAIGVSAVLSCGSTHATKSIIVRV